MFDDLENIYMRLFRFVGNGFRLALCNVCKLSTRKFVVLVPDRIVFAPWSVLLDRAAGFVSLANTPPLDVVLCSLLAHAPSQVHQQGEQHPRRPRRTVLLVARSMECVLLVFPLQTGNLIAAAVRKRRRRLQRVLGSASRAEPTNSGADRC